MKKIASTLFIALLAIGTPVLAQDQPGTSKLLKTHTGERTFMGKVTEYLPGKSLTVTSADKKMESFKLDDNDVITNIDPTVAMGVQVRVVVRKDASGKKSVSVEPTSELSPTG
jgi:hypothetical protein